MEVAVGDPVPTNVFPVLNTCGMVSVSMSVISPAASIQMQAQSSVFVAVRSVSTLALDQSVVISAVAFLLLFIVDTSLFQPVLKMH